MTTTTDLAAAAQQVIEGRNRWVLIPPHLSLLEVTTAVREQGERGSILEYVSERKLKLCGPAEKGPWHPDRTDWRSMCE